jgi:hypothetical protein
LAQVGVGEISRWFSLFFSLIAVTCKKKQRNGGTKGFFSFLPVVQILLYEHGFEHRCQLQQDAHLHITGLKNRENIEQMHAAKHSIRLYQYFYRKFRATSMT